MDFGRNDLGHIGTGACAIAGLIIGIIALCERSNADTSGFLKTDGSNHMTGNLNMDGHGFTNLPFLTLENEPVVATPPSGSTNFYSTGGGNLTQIDEFGTTYTFLTTTPTGDFLPRDGSKPMLGHLDMGTNVMLNIVSLVTPSTDNNVVFGSGTTVTQTPNQTNILLGVNNAASGSNEIAIGSNIGIRGGNVNMAIGTTHAVVGSTNSCCGASLNLITGNGNDVYGTDNIISTANFQLIFGNNNSVSSGAASCCILGSNNFIDVNITNGCIVGFNNTQSANNAVILGNNTVNTLPNTICVGTGITSLYPIADSSTNLGTTTLQFTNAYLANNVYLAGLPAPICQFSSYSTTTVANTTINTVYSGVNHVGNLTLVPMQPGAVVRITVNFILTLASTVSGDAIHLNLNNVTGGTQLASTFITLPTNTALANDVGTLTYTLVIRDANNLFQTTFASLNAVGSNASQALVSYPSTSSQTLSLSAQFDIGVNVNMTAEQIIIETLFRTA